MPLTPLRALQNLEPINEADFAAVENIRERLGSLSRWAMADHFGQAAHPLAEPVDLRELASAVQKMGTVVGPDAAEAAGLLAAKVRQASAQLSACGTITAEQRSDIEQLWQAIVQVERAAHQDPGKA